MGRKSLTEGAVRSCINFPKLFQAGGRVWQASGLPCAAGPLRTPKHPAGLADSKH